MRVPPPEAEDERLLPWEREGLLRDVGRLRNRAGSVLFALGCRGGAENSGGFESLGGRAGKIGTELAGTGGRADGARIAAAAGALMQRLGP